jgi:hypothetical protein
MNATLVGELLADIEKARRDKDYISMWGLSHKLQGELVDDASSDACAAARAKMLYEHHMAAYQEGHFETSMELAQQSALEARKANDPVGALFTQLNISGLLLPALGKRAEGFTLSLSVYAEATAIVDRANRVAVDALFHQIKMIMEDSGPRSEVKRLLDLAETNPLYQRLKDDPEANRWVVPEGVREYASQ